MFVKSSVNDTPAITMNKGRQMVSISPLFKKEKQTKTMRAKQVKRSLPGMLWLKGWMDMKFPKFTQLSDTYTFHVKWSIPSHTAVNSVPPECHQLLQNHRMKAKSCIKILMTIVTSLLWLGYKSNFLKK